MTAAPSPDRREAYRDVVVCVTGGAGFIGSHLCDALVAAGARVRVLDDLSHGREANLAGVRDRVELRRGSILDPAALDAAFAGARLVFHQAALTSVPRSVEAPARSLEVNAVGTLRVLEAARRAGVARVVSASSSSVYGDQVASPKVETLAARPMSPYAAAEGAGEALVRAFARSYGLAAASLRYFNIFGPRQRPDSPYAAVVPRFIEAMRAGREITIYGDGAQTRDFTYVGNAVRANLLAGAVEPAPAGEVVNVACGSSHAVNELVARLAALLGVEPRVTHAPARTGEVRHSLASIARAEERLGYAAEIGFAEGLRRTVEASGGLSGP